MGRDEVILVDTHVVIWSANNDTALGPTSRSIIAAARADGSLVVSAITFWEVALLFAKERLKLSDTPQILRRDFLAAGAKELPIDGVTALLSVDLKDLPGDPADRFIMATAIANNAKLVTADQTLLRWRHPLERQDARV